MYLIATKYFRWAGYNQFSGPLPQTFGDILGIKSIRFVASNLTGEFPETFSKLTNLNDLWISDNQFTGKIPSFKNWRNLTRLEIQASGLEGPIPSDISVLEKLDILIISDLDGIEGSFPPLNNLNLTTLILRNCNISGTLPAYLGNMTKLRTLDLSFNKLSGEIPDTFVGLGNVQFMYLTGNLLSGSIPSWMRTIKNNIDLSYNNFTLEDSLGCQLNSNINLFGSSSMRNVTSLPPCLKRHLPCQPDRYSFNINCGGREVNENNNTKYDDDQSEAGASRFYQSTSNWAFSSTGHFVDNLEKGYIE